MDSFEERVKTARSFISLLTKFFWEDPEVKKDLLHVNLGYETFIPDEVRELLRTLNSDQTARFIRFLPDYLVVRRDGSLVFMLEYKVSKTPRYSEGEDQWHIAQMESAPFENYLTLTEKLGLRIAICLFVPYCEKPIYMDRVQRYKENLIRSSVRPRSSLGSGTPYVNVDTRGLSLLTYFLKEELGVEGSIIKRCFSKDFWRELEENEHLRVRHHPNSPYKDRSVRWDVESMMAF